MGPVSEQCTWEYGDYGAMLECGRTDEVIHDKTICIDLFSYC